MSYNLLQFSLRSLDTGQISPTAPQDVGDAHGKQPTRDRTHNVHPVVGNAI